MIEVEYVGGIVNAGMWLEDGKNLSRNFRQGNRVYSEEGLATSLTAQSVGGLGGNTSLYLVNINKRKEDETLDEIINPLKGISEYGWHFEQQVHDPYGIARTVKANGGSGNIPKVILTENKRKEDEHLEIKTIDKEELETKPFKYISLFAGIGGFDFGLNAVGGECVFASEIDKFAKQAYTTLHGLEPHGDITKIDAKDIPDHDVIAAGFPCQSFSVAGKRGGFEDARGTLFFEVARIASEKQPKVLLLENVKGLVGHDKGKTLDTIVKTLNEIGYRVDFEVLNSKYFGVPQNRERIFIVAIREDLVANEPWNIVGNTVVPKGKRRISEYDDVKTFNFDFPEHGEVTTRLRDILEPSVDVKYYLSEEKTAKLVVQLEASSSDEVRATALQNANMQGRRIKGNDEPSFTVSATDRHGVTLSEPQMQGRPFVGESEEVRPVLTPEYANKAQNGRRFKEDGEESFTLTAQDRHGIAIREATKRGYAVASEGDAVNIMFPTSKTRRGRVGKDGQAQTLEASGVNQGVVLPELRIRKLTPLECWRLQGFTDEQHNAVEASGISNSQRYKQAGNAVTVNVIEAIGSRLLPYL